MYSLAVKQTWGDSDYGVGIKQRFRLLILESEFESESFVVSLRWSRNRSQNCGDWNRSQNRGDWNRSQNRGDWNRSQNRGDWNRSQNCGDCNRSQNRGDWNRSRNRGDWNRIRMTIPIPHMYVDL